MLTPEQTKKYYQTQSKLAKPLSPLQFEKSLKTTTPLGQFNQAPEQEKPTTLGDTEPKGDMAPKTDKTALGGIIGERAGDKSDRDVLLERLTSGISGAKDYDPVERRQTLEEERGLPEARERIGSYEQEISKTNELLDSLESDIKARTGEFLMGEPARKRVLASERDPLMKQLGISQRGLGLAESGMKRKEGAISDILGEERAEAYRPLDLLKGEVDIRSSIDKLFPDQDTDQVGSIIGAIQSGGSEDPLDIYNSLQEQGVDVDINEIVNTLEQIQSVRQEIEKDTQVVKVGGKQILIDKNTGETVKDLGYAEATGTEGPGYFEGAYSPDVELSFAEEIDIRKLPDLGGKRITDKSARQAGLPFGITDKQANWIRQHRPGNASFQSLVGKDKGFDSLASLMELKEDLQEIRDLKEEVNTGWISQLEKRGQRMTGWETERIDNFSKLEIKTGKELAIYIKSISGAAVSEQEAQRLARNIPNVGMQDDQFVISLDDYEDDINDLIQAKLRQYDLENKEELRNAVRGLESGQEQMINVVSPDGTVGTIPQSQLQEALAEGYTQQ